MRRATLPKRELLRYREANDYAEHFSACFETAVRRRLPEDGPVAVAMSGGLDSTSIGTTAAELRADPQSVRSYSFVFDDLDECDERAWIEPVIEHAGLSGTMVLSDDRWPVLDFSTRLHDAGMPSLDVTARATEILLNLARADGCRRVLHGLFGDDLFLGGQSWAEQMLRDGRFAELMDTLIRGPAWSWRTDLIDGGIRPLIPQSVRDLTRRVFPRTPTEGHWATKQALLVLEELKGSPTPIGRDAFRRHLLAGPATRLIPALRRFHRRHGMEASFPFHDRDLVEFVLALPLDRLGVGVMTKRVLRHAMRDRLPDVVRGRSGKTAYSALLTRGLQREHEKIRALLDQPYLVDMGLVRGDWLRSAFEVPDERERALRWRFLTLELWLRHFTNRVPGPAG